MSSYIVYADEAWTHDARHRFWRFYGGALLRASDREQITQSLLDLKTSLGLQGEMKWSKVRPFNWERIASLIEHFLKFVNQGDIKLRYMWLDQLFQDPTSQNEYYRLYYFFLVFAFGLPHHDEEETIKILFYPDTLPDQPEERRKFSDFLQNCHKSDRFRNRKKFQIMDVVAVDSKHHIILQCVDLIIGSIGFRLNGLHKVTQENGRRAESTKVKEKLYKHIYTHLRPIAMKQQDLKTWSPGVNTSINNDYGNLWRHNFRQWDFRTPGILNPEWLKPNKGER